MLACIRIVLASIWFGLACIIGTVATILRPFRVKNGTEFCRLAAGPLFKILGIKIVAPDEETMKARTPCLFIGNHQANLDLPFVGSRLPHGTLPVGKKSIIWIPLFGIIYWLAGGFFIDRGNSGRAQQTLKRVARTMRERGLSIVYFPEGTRSRQRGLLPFKKGAFHLALETQLPLQPFVVSPYHKVIYWNRWNAGTLHFTLLPPIPAPKSVEEIPATLAFAQAAIAAELERLGKLT